MKTATSEKIVFCLIQAFVTSFNIDSFESVTVTQSAAFFNCSNHSAFADLNVTNVNKYENVPSNRQCIFNAQGNDTVMVIYQPHTKLCWVHTDAREYLLMMMHLNLTNEAAVQITEDSGCQFYVSSAHYGKVAAVIEADLIGLPVNRSGAHPDTPTTSASEANDGDRRRDCHTTVRCMYTNTEWDQAKWWIVDLGVSRMVHRVKVFYTSNCCYSFFFDITVGLSLDDSVWEVFDWSKFVHCYRFEGPPASSSPGYVIFPCDGKEGKYLTVHKDALTAYHAQNGWLTIPEVEMWYHGLQ